MCWRPVMVIKASCRLKCGPAAPGPGSREADQAGAVECGRLDGSGGAARPHSEIGLGGLAGETGNGARLAPRIGAKEMGDLPGTTTPWPAADLSGVSSPDRADGARESAPGLLPDPRRAPEAWAPSRCDHAIRSVLIAAGVPPSGRRSQLTW